MTAPTPEGEGGGLTGEPVRTH